jgi:SIR2-like domain
VQIGGPADVGAELGVGRVEGRGLKEADDDHYSSVAEKLAAGRMIPFLGAGANLCDRGDLVWESGSPFLPSGAELAAYLAARGRYPEPDDHNLVRISQYLEAARGEDELYLYLREIFKSGCPPTSLHRLLATVARHLADSGGPHLVSITTNYDDLLEQALTEEGLDFDVVWYEAKTHSQERGHFRHRAPGKRPVAISRPNKYKALPIELERPAVLKLHGCTDQQSADDDSYVITEDSYIDYLSGGDIGALIPIALWQRLTSSSMLFLGYSMADWNLRVVLNRVWGARKLAAKSWSIQREPPDPRDSKIEQTLWDRREMVDLIYCDLREYVSQLTPRIQAPASVQTR